MIEPERNYHIYPLENVAAEDIATVLDEFLRDAARLDPQGGTGGRAQNQQGSSSNDNEVVVVPDAGTNSLLIAASKTRYEEVEDLVRQLDRRQDQVLIETALDRAHRHDAHRHRRRARRRRGARQRRAGRPASA